MAFLSLILTFSLPLAISANVLEGQQCDVSNGEVYLGKSTEADFAACKNICEQNPKCQSVTFYTHHGGCSLFSTKCEATVPESNARSVVVKELGGLYGQQCDTDQGEIWLSGKEHIADFAACKKACEDDAGCQSITYYVNGDCSLFKTKCEKTKADGAARSAVVKELEGLQGKQCDIEQGEIWLSEAKKADFAACKKACEDAARCQSITYYQNRGSCSLFATKCQGVKDNDAATAALVREFQPPAPEQCELDGTCTVSHGQQCDIGQGEVYMSDGSAELSYAECKQACLDRTACQSITYFAHGWCSLFQSQCEHRQYFKDAISVTLKADYFNNQECDESQGEVRLPGSSGNQADLAACKQSCEDDAECKSTTFFKSGWCNHFSTCCNERKASANADAGAVKTAQCVDACVIENGGCDSKRACTSTDGVATCGDCPAGFNNDGATGCKKPSTTMTGFIRIDNVKHYQKIINLREISAYDHDGNVIAPLSTTMSSQHGAGPVGNCNDGKNDKKFCHSDDAKDKNPWLVFQYQTGTDISKIVVVNRNDNGLVRKRIVGATIRICSDPECTEDVLWSGTFEGDKSVYTFLPATTPVTPAPATPDAARSGSICKSGLFSGRACCLKSCGSCGGKRCNHRKGGSSGCCSDAINNSGRSCATHDPPCVGTTDFTAVCSGVSDGGRACCLKSCGSCGGKRCNTRPGGNAGCCSGAIKNSGRVCGNVEPPCFMPK